MSAMDSQSTWQKQALGDLVQLFRRDSATRALVLTGSLADAEVQADMWSDIDMKVVLADHAVGKYFTSLTWLRGFGEMIGLERHESSLSKTLRICLADYHRFDFVFVPESSLQIASAWEAGIFHQPCVVLWSGLPDLEAQIGAHADVPAYISPSAQDLTRMVDQFWFTAASAVGKVVRNDLLIGLHLALDLARDCLVMQMILRDEEKRTTIHRTGGWGNDLAARLSYRASDPTALGVLDLIKQSCSIFDELAVLLIPGYEPRGAYLLPSVEAAQRLFNGCPQGQ